jgi:hypothetical protein
MIHLTHKNLVENLAHEVARQIPFSFTDFRDGSTVNIVRTAGSYFKSDKDERWSLSDMRRVSKEPKAIKKVLAVTQTLNDAPAEISVAVQTVIDAGVEKLKKREVYDKMTREDLEIMYEALGEANAHIRKKMEELKGTHSLNDSERSLIRTALDKKAYEIVKINTHFFDEPQSFETMQSIYNSDRLDAKGIPFESSRVLIRKREGNIFHFSPYANASQIVTASHLFLIKKREK